MAELGFDLVEQILIRLDVEDLIRCKSVCKWWHSFISSPRFVKAHLNHTYNNDRNNPELGHRRISNSLFRDDDHYFFRNYIHIAGSCNGLVCVCPRAVGFVVINPSTKEERILPRPPYRPHMRKLVSIRQVVCVGFGYDSSTDDYKVIAGFRRSLDKKRTRFHVFALKSNTWKVIGQVKWRSVEGRTGILCGGALHWFMIDKNDKKAIISLNLSTEEFKEIPQPDANLLYEWKHNYRLGVVDESLCIYTACSFFSSTEWVAVNDMEVSHPIKKWVMKNNKWELSFSSEKWIKKNNKWGPYFETKYDVAHFLTLNVVSSRGYLWGYDDGKRVPSARNHMRASIFIKSLVSPHPHVDSNDNFHEKQKRNAKQGQEQEQERNKSVESGAKKGNMRKRKRTCKHKKPHVWA